MAAHAQMWQTPAKQLERHGDLVLTLEFVQTGRHSKASSRTLPAFVSTKEPIGTRLLYAAGLLPLTQ